MKQATRMLKADHRAALERIAAIDQEIMEMGPEFHEALTQSSETWHDNAPFDALRERQEVLQAEQLTLREAMQSAEIVLPPVSPKRVAIGCIVTVADGKTAATYAIAGDVTQRAGHRHESGALIMSSQSPLARTLLGARRGATVIFRGRAMNIVGIAPFHD